MGTLIVLTIQKRLNQDWNRSTASDMVYGKEDEENSDRKCIEGIFSYLY